MTNQHSEFNPDYSYHPGIFLEEELEVKGMTQAELAKRSGITAKTINSIIKGSASISSETAVILECVLGKSASYWLGLDSQYQIHKAKVENDELLSKEISFLDELDLKCLIKERWIEQFTDRLEQLKELYRFFGVASKKQIPQVWSQLEVSYRTSEKFQQSHLHILAWLRRGELLAHQIKCSPFDAKKFKDALLNCRKLTVEEFSDMRIKLQEICAEAGVAVVCVPEIKKVSTSGAARWLDKNKAMIQLSLRGKRDDKFWFNFYHEAGHILLHGRKEQFIDNNGKANPLSEDSYHTEENRFKEKEADEFAANYLIPRKDFSLFVSNSDFSESSICQFAKTQGIAPGIVVGQLQSRGYLDWSQLNNLKKKYDF
ncbi:addiction module HigA family antidote [Alteromonas sp. I10]|uniref:Addiction module antidote protein, HigA family n=1 Tax=Alteromonas mediterranea TaxID=314275 RepID=A0AAC9NT70_9ALTE|nr:MULTISPECIES: HigA family addiction module antitoxin [Alteromonas]APD91022.1 addiction module antidote protein, HigA family [Alteromonas mediterranea]PXW69701.1 addiction module HigA family antidote [Alteromonas sp. I10]